MLHDVIEVKSLGDYKVFLRFDDDQCGQLDLAQVISFEGIFEPLKDKNYFATVAIHPELGTIYWKNGADIAPDYLYKLITTKD